MGNGSTYRMIPLIWKTTSANELKATRESSAVIGIAGAIGALGRFAIPMTSGHRGSPSPVDAVERAFVVLACFYGVCLAVNWFFYSRKSLLVAECRRLLKPESES